MFVELILRCHNKGKNCNILNKTPLKLLLKQFILKCSLFSYNLDILKCSLFSYNLDGYLNDIFDGKLVFLIYNQEMPMNNATNCIKFSIVSEWMFTFGH